MSDDITINHETDTGVIVQQHVDNSITLQGQLAGSLGTGFDVNEVKDMFKEDQGNKGNEP